MTGRGTRALLACGVLATPLFFAVALPQAATRVGFELGPHMISQLATGDGGWLQVGTFVGAGVLFVLGAVGVRRVLPRDRPWLARSIGVFGLGVVAAGVFVTDAANGYPVGSADTVTWHGVLHLAAASVSGLALLGAVAVQVRHSVAAREPVWALAGVLAGLAYLALPAMDPARVGLMFAIGSVIGWGWLSVVMARLLAATRTTTRETLQPA